MLQNIRSIGIHLAELHEKPEHKDDDNMYPATCIEF